MAQVLDLNCDMGESYGAWTMGNDMAILPYVTSANIACGFHAGDPGTMRSTVAAALELGVAVGAHPGLPDLVGFGRRTMAVSPQEAYDMMVVQIGALAGVAASQGGRLHHVKPHGALYNMAARNPELAHALAKAVFDMDASLIFYGLASSELTRAAEQMGLRVAHEVFADRTYQSDGTLTPRSHPEAMIHDSDVSTQQVLRMVQQGCVHTLQGTDVSLRADTLCLHGDQPGALHFAQQIRRSLNDAGIQVRAP